MATPVKQKPGGPSFGAPPPLPPKKGTASTGSAFNAFINAHPSMRPYADLIWKWASATGVDKVVAATLLWHESFAEAARQGVSPETIVSPNGHGVGLGQINPSVWIGKTTPWGHVIKQKDLIDPDFNIRFSLSYFASLPGNIDQKYAHYSGGANYTLSTELPKGYVPRTGLTPTEKGSVTAVQTAADRSGATVLFDKWAVLGADGRVKFVKITDPSAPPKNVLKYGPTPLTQTQFLATWKQTYQDTFFSYTGRQASGKEIASILKNAPSQYTLANTLATTKSFTTSPTYKAHAPGIIAVAKQDFGEDWKVDKNFVAQAISQNWDQATLEENLRNRPEYMNGPTFKTNVAQMSNVFQGIFGSSNAPATQQLLQHVALQGWSQDQFAAYLRSQPEYSNSQEYKTKALSFAQQLGLITGSVPTLSADQASIGAAPSYPGAPAAAPPPPVTSQPPIAEPTHHPTKPPAPFGPFPAVAYG